MLRWATVVELQKEAVKELRCVCGGDAEGLFAADRRGVLAWSAAVGDFELKAPRRKRKLRPREPQRLPTRHWQA